MLKVVARNETKKCLKRHPVALKVEKNVLGKRKSENGRYVELLSMYVDALKIAGEKNAAFQKASKESTEAYEKAFEIHNELRRLSGKVDVFDRKMK